MEALLKDEELKFVPLVEVELLATNQPFGFLNVTLVKFVQP